MVYGQIIVLAFFFPFHEIFCIADLYNRPLSYKIIFFLYWALLLVFFSLPLTSWHIILPTSPTKPHINLTATQVSSVITQFHLAVNLTRRQVFSVLWNIQLWARNVYLLVYHKFVWLRIPCDHDWFTATNMPFGTKFVSTFPTIFYDDKHFPVYLRENLHHLEESPLGKKDFSYSSWKCYS